MTQTERKRLTDKESERGEQTKTKPTKAQAQAQAGGAGEAEAQSEGLNAPGEGVHRRGSPRRWGGRVSPAVRGPLAGTPGSLYRGSGSGSVAGGGRVLGRGWGPGKPPGLRRCCCFSRRQERLRPRREPQAGGSDD